MAARLLVLAPPGHDRNVLLTLLAKADGFSIRVDTTPQRAWRVALSWQPHLVLLLTSLETAKALCAQWRGEPKTSASLLVLMCRDPAETEVVVALEAGIDDVIDLSAAAKEVFWRIVAVLRRAGGIKPTPADLRRGPIRLDGDRRAVWVSGRSLRLSRKEFDLLDLFLRAEGRALTRRYLLETIWGSADAATFQAVDILVSRLRRKLGPAGKGLCTLYGVGYAFKILPRA